MKSTIVILLSFLINYRLALPESQAFVPVADNFTGCAPNKCDSTDLNGNHGYASKKKNPSLVGILASLSGKNYDILCEGVLITNDSILTSASCFKDVNLRNPIRVFMGTNNSRESNNTKRVYIDKDITLINHPRFNRDTLVNNIALLKLKQPVVLKIGSVELMRLDNTTIQNKDRFNVSGWGFAYMNYNSSYPTQGNLIVNSTSSFAVDIISKENCTRYYSNQNIVTTNKVIRDDLICVVIRNNTTPGELCQSNNAAPLIKETNNNLTLAGILQAIGAFVFPKENRRFGCQENYPMVFTAIPPYLSWIEQQVPAIKTIKW